MKTILSNYETIISLDDTHSLLVNGLYGALDVVDRAEADALSEGEAGRLDAKELERLMSRGHLTDSPETEIGDFKMLTGVYRRFFAERTLVLHIIPTYDCNFRCPYCYEKHRLSCGEEWMKKTMSKEMADKIFAVVEKEKKRGIAVPECGLYGGEPFLPENSEIIEHIAKKAAEAGMKLRAVTNGYSLEHFQDILSGYPFKSLQITLDGTKEENDRRRVFIGGGGSYDKILENISLVLSKGVHVHVRINTGPGNIDSVHDLMQVFEEKGFTGHPEFHYYFAPTEGENYPGKDYGVSSGDIVENLVRNGFEKKDAMKHVAEYGKIVSKLTRLMEKKEYLMPVDSYCGAEKMMYLIDREGAVYTCWDFAAIDKMRVGSIDMEKEKFAFNFELLKWTFRNTAQMPECMRCPYVFVCGGGCAAKAYMKTGDLRKPHCGGIREIFKDAAAVLCGEHFHQTGEREMTKSLKEAVSRYTPEERNALMTSRDPKLVLDLMEEKGLVFNQTVTEECHSLSPQ